MNFDFSEEQNMLKDSVARFVQDDYDFETRTAIANSDAGFDRSKWNTFAELGWLSVPFAEEHGGFGGGVNDVAMVMEELGKGLVLEPYLATVALFGGALQKSDSKALQATYIPKIIDGSCLGALAFLEEQSRFELADVTCTAKKEGDGYVINGRKVVVFNGANADAIIVSARTGGNQSDEQGISLMLLDANAAGIEKTSYRMMDGQLVANLDFANAKGQLLGEEGAGLSLLQAVVNDAIVALSAEALGIMEKLNSKTLEYAKTREQFGVKIGSFQALQHRMVDTFIAYEQSKSMVYRAYCEIEDDATDQTATLHALKTMVDRSGTLIGNEAVQLHGGIGMTDELDIGHYFRRLLMINATFGNGDYHQAKYNALRYGAG